MYLSNICIYDENLKLRIRKILKTIKNNNENKEILKKGF